MAEQDGYSVLTDTPFGLTGAGFGAASAAPPPPPPFASLGSLGPSPSRFSPAQEAVLEHIHAGEAQGWNTLYGGGTFSSYADHPRQHFQVPGSRLGTSAAGGLQFQPATWDAQAKKLGLKDFSPESQKIAGWDLASTTYGQKTGRNLEADAAAGKVQWSALAGQWPSLAGQGVGPAVGRAGGGGGGGGGGATAMGGAVPPTSWSPSSAAAPPLSADGLSPQHMLLAAAMPHVKITPIDYDPFKVMPPAQGPM